jgi:hypothetical protein
MLGFRKSLIDSTCTPPALVAMLPPYETMLTPWAAHSGTSAATCGVSAGRQTAKGRPVNMPRQSVA